MKISSFLFSAIFIFAVSLNAQVTVPNVNVNPNLGDAATKLAISEFKKIAQDIPFDYKSADLALTDPKYSVAGYNIDAFMKQVLIPALAKLVAALPIDKKVVIDGHASEVGSDGYNVALSKERAEAVLQYILKNSSLDKSKFKIKASSFHKQLPNVDSKDNKNCRVSFDIE